MRLSGLFDLSHQAHPIPNGGDFAKRDSGLHHPEWARIHAQKNHPARSRGKPANVTLVNGPCVLERVEHSCDWRREMHQRQLSIQRSGGRQ
jgi:hypothetical protein